MSAYQDLLNADVAGERLQEGDGALHFTHSKCRETAQWRADHEPCKVDKGGEGVEKEDPESTGELDIVISALVSASNTVHHSTHKASCSTSRTVREAISSAT